MSEKREYKPPQSEGGEYNKENQPYEPPQSQGGQYEKEKQGYEPPATPPPEDPCPDPCDETPPWGPPKIRPDCCPPHECCPDDEKHCCTWDEVDDPCVRAASADCVGTNWAKIECKCESSNAECGCEEWDCGGYPQGTCVPCKPCAGLIPDPEEPTGGCDDPGTDDCTSENLIKQLEALNQCISSQQGAKARLEADIKARAERATALKELIKSYDDIIKKYKEQRYKLICKEDCLKGFYRDVSSDFETRYTANHLQELTKAINLQLCQHELARCCEKNLEGRLTKVTKLIWEQQQAEQAMKKADQAVAIIKDLPKWMEERFKELETLRDEIDAALNDVDPQKQKWAFYLFYWKFAPKLCKCFPFPFCCKEKPAEGTENPNQPNPQNQSQQPNPQYQSQQGNQQNQGQQANQQNQGQQANQQNQGQQNPPAHLGCKPGDWHPSAITDAQLRALICCAWDYARQRKQDYQDATDKVADANNNLDFIKKKVEADSKTLDERIKSGLDRVTTSAPTSS